MTESLSLNVKLNHTQPTIAKITMNRNSHIALFFMTFTYR